VTRDATYWIDKLGLARHPEGGYYRETYRAAGSVSTAIFYLLESDDVSRLHRLRSDELFHFYVGAPMTVHVIDEGGDYRRIALGREPDEGQVLQAVVPAGQWFGATVERPGGFALVGCTVAPGFDFKHFEQAERSALVERFPHHRAVIESLTRP
jgi:predicted cupin superfamily sugar epimerase